MYENYTFVYKELSPESKPNYQPYIRITFFFKKLPHLSDDTFHRYWETVHADLNNSMSSFRSSGARSYSQLHITPEAKELAAGLGIEQLDFDGASEFLVARSDYDKFKAFTASEEYRTILAEDAKTFIDTPVKILVSYENLIYGKAVAGSGGKDGIVSLD